MKFFLWTSDWSHDSDSAITVVGKTGFFKKQITPKSLIGFISDRASN